MTCLKDYLEAMYGVSSVEDVSPEERDDLPSEFAKEIETQATS